MYMGLIGDIGPATTEFYYQNLVRAHFSAGRAMELTIVHADVRDLVQMALHHAARICETPVEEVWIGTDTIQTDAELQLSSFHAVWRVPASPYASADMMKAAK